MSLESSATRWAPCSQARDRAAAWISLHFLEALPLQARQTIKAACHRMQMKLSEFNDK